MPDSRFFLAEAEQAGQRLDQFLAGRSRDHSRAYIQSLIAEGRVLVNGEVLAKSRRLRAGDSIEVDWPLIQSFELKPEFIPFAILEENEDYLLINKPPDLTVHPGAGTQKGTLVNALLGYDYEHFSQFPEDSERPGIVHRLDKDTSGIMLVARNPRSRAKLSQAFADRKTKKIYLALVSGSLRQSEGSLTTLIGRNPRNRKKMAVVQRKGKEAITRYRSLSEGPDASLVELRPETGRTHQLRVHLAHLGCPLLGDTVYGRSAGRAPRQMLHAWKLQFPHPLSAQPQRAAAPLPQDFLDTAAAEKVDIPEACLA